jgi:hypothetical protein
MNKIFDKLFFIGSVGLGDSFVLNGMANHFGDRCLELHLPAQPKFFKTIEELYKDHPNIKVIPMVADFDIENNYVENHKLSRILRIDLIKSTIKNFTLIPMWDIQLYSNYELSYSLRYSNFRLPKDLKGSDDLFDKLYSGEPYALIHRYTGDSTEGIPINVQSFREAAKLPPLKFIEIQEGITDNMLDYVKLIQNAREIHVVPSSFHCLVDSIHTNAALYFHDIREKTAMAVNSGWGDNKWIIVNYPNRV